jgi:hypothetical protein
VSLDKRPLPTRDDALFYAREMVPKLKWDSISIEEGNTETGGPGLVMKPCEDCWIISYDPAPARDQKLEERIWVEKVTGVVVKMVLDD